METGTVVLIWDDSWAPALERVAVWARLFLQTAVQMHWPQILENVFAKLLQVVAVAVEAAEAAPLVLLLVSIRLASSS
jgi:hypothetical protein